MSETRAAPLYCPYCGDEDLRPHEDVSGSWECRSCVRVFSVKLVGLLAPGGSPAGSAGLAGLAGSAGSAGGHGGGVA